MRAVFTMMSQFRWSRDWAVTINCWTCLLCPSFVSELLGDINIKNPHYCSKTVGVVSAVMWSTSTSFTFIHITNGVIAAATGAIFCWPVPGSKIVLCSEEGSEKRVGAGEREGGFFHFSRLRSPFLDHARPIFPWPCFRDVPTPLLAPVVQTLDSTIHRINHYLTDKF